ncbi:MAG: CopG family antitoxin [Alphaproteobacteria bacterium]
MRIPEPLPNAIKAKAATRGIPYQRLIRELMQAAVQAALWPK